ncbi:hypothetical protein [Tautonia rosea]|uniref:hypothetical protein n=1 Tax=Tautonia rosea TaxID=2728037 RepID=UPI001472A714|nr:hypothetical protein [Tautonia rosea]
MSTRARWVMLFAVLATLTTGCHRKEFIRNQSVAMDPSLVSIDPALSDPMLTQPSRATFVDRHPLLRKPVEYYQTAKPHPAHRLASATFIGVPAGILGEMRQIIVGCPPGF